jgi:hypothetical protein
MTRSFCFILLIAFVVLPTTGQSLEKLNDGEPHGDPPFLLESGWRSLFNGQDLSGWHGQDGKPHEWIATRAIRWEPQLAPTRLFPMPAPGDRMLNSVQGRTTNLVTNEKFSDIELYLEFIIPKASNSGVYLHGLYEIQVFDSFGTAEPMETSDCGGIYHRWIDGKGVGGSLPAVNASRRPGEWQSFQVWFRVPRFDAAGKKVENAKFIRVLHNGQLVQENVELEGPTRAHMNIPEAQENPLMLQGDHGPIAFRNIYVHALRPIVRR